MCCPLFRALFCALALGPIFIRLLVLLVNRFLEFTTIHPRRYRPVTHFTFLSVPSRVSRRVVLVVRAAQFRKLRRDFPLLAHDASQPRKPLRRPIQPVGSHLSVQLVLLVMLIPAATEILVLVPVEQVARFNQHPSSLVEVGVARRILRLLHI